MAASSLRLWFMQICCVPMLFACDPDCERQPAYVPALRIQVLDAESHEPICDAHVELEHAGSVERLAPGCRYTGGTQAGNYDIRVSRTSYAEQELSNISVAGDECDYATTKEIVIELVPIT